MYKQLLKNEKIKVYHLKGYIGKSGQKYKIDLSFKFKKVDVDFLVLIECKYYNMPVHVGDVLEFSAKLEDIGAHKGIIVSTKGFQKGALNIAYAKGIALIKEYRYGEFIPVIAEIGPLAPELIYYFADYSELAHIKNITSYSKLCVDRNSIGTIIFDSVKEFLTLNENDQKNKEITNISSKDTFPAWLDWNMIISVHEQIHAKIRNIFLGNNQKFQKIKVKSRNAIDKANNFHENNNNDKAIAEIKKIKEEIDGAFCNNTDFNPKVTIKDIPECIFWLAHFYLSKTIECCASDWENKRKYKSNTDLLIAENYCKNFEKEMILIGETGSSRDYLMMEILLDLAKIYYHIDSLEEAESTFRRAISASPNLPEPYNDLGRFYLRIQKYEDSITIFQELISKDLDNKNDSIKISDIAYYNIACAYALLNNNTEALNYLKKALKNPLLRQNASKDSDFNNLRLSEEFQKIIKD